LSLSWGSICNCSHLLLLTEWIWRSLHLVSDSHFFLSFFFLLFSHFFFYILKKKWDGIYTTETYTQQLKQESNGWLVYAIRNDEKKRKTFFSLVKVVKRKSKWEKVRKKMSSLFYKEKKNWEMKRDQMKSVCMLLLSNVWINRLVCLFLLVIDRCH